MIAREHQVSAREFLKRLPTRPRSADRTRSPIAISQKREYFKYSPETIGDFSLEVAKFKVCGPTTNLQSRTSQDLAHGTLPLRLHYRGCVKALGIAVRARIPEATTNPTTQCRSNPVSSRGLQKTGIFQIFAGDYRRFIPGSGQIWSPETNDQLAKARCRRAFLRLPRTASLKAGLPGWGGRIRTATFPVCKTPFEMSIDFRPIS
jgi:hypothetical protein